MPNQHSPYDSLKRLLQATRRHRPRVLAAVACSIINKIWDLAPPVLIGAAVDVVVKREASLLASWGLVDVELQLQALVALTVVVWGLESLFEYLYAWLWRTLAQTIQHELRVEAWAHVLELDMAWFAERPQGELMAVLNDDINQLERFLDGGANDLLQVGTTVLVVGAAFTGVAPTIAAVAILPIPIILWGSFAFQSRIAPRYAAVRERVGHLNALLANDIHGLATIRAFTGEQREVERVRGASDALQDANREAIRLSAAFSPLIRMAIVVGFAATLLLGGRQVLEGALEVGTYSVLVFMTQRLLWPLTRLGATFDLYQRAMASTRRVLDLLDTPSELPDGEGEVGQVSGDLAFRGVDFHYPGRDPVLEGFDLEVPAGTSLGVVGPTGAGKSTLVRLLLRFFDPQVGAVTLDGVDLRRLRVKELRQAVAFVGQEVFLFPGSVRDNIAYARPGASDEAVEEAARLAEAHDFITALPEGYDTRIGEQGRKLSGGQRQRLALARAVLCDAPILVLDEATSAVDNETEAAIQRSLARLIEGRTSVQIAHRLSTVRHVDRIVVMEGGRIVEQGRHEALVAADGLYARLWRVQTGER